METGSEIEHESFASKGLTDMNSGSQTSICQWECEAVPNSTSQSASCAEECEITIYSKLFCSMSDLVATS